MKLFGDLLRRDKPLAQAVLKGGEEASGLYGKVNFYPAFEGVLICAEIFDLPKGEGNCPGKTFGFHIHEGRAVLVRRMILFLPPVCTIIPEIALILPMRGICRR